MIHAIPYILSGLSLFNLWPIWQGRRAILRGDWRLHRNHMMVALLLWSASLLLFVLYLRVRGLKVLIAVPEMLFGLYVTSAVSCALFLGLTVWHIAGHRRKAHKRLARRTLFFWLWTCLLGILFYPLTDARIYPVAG